MKKALALILTAAMLFSCLAVGASAARVWEKETHVNSRNCGYGENDNFWFYTTDDPNGLTISVDVLLETADSKLDNAFKLTSSYVGFSADNKVDYKFETNKWYNVALAMADGSTTISIDGTAIGTISGVVNLFYGAIVGNTQACFIDNVTTKKADGEVLVYEDYEDDDNVLNTGWGGPAPRSTYKTETYSYTNENVAASVDYACNFDGAFSGIEQVVNDRAYVSATFKVMSYEDNLGENTPHVDGTPIINMKGGKLGIRGLGEIDYTFEAHKWYEIEFYTGENNTFIYVNGEQAGKISGTTEKHSLYASWYRLRFTEVTYKVGDDVVKQVTFDPDQELFFGSSADVIEIREDLVRSDLGLKYWLFDADNAYFYSEEDFGGKDVSFDFIFLSDESNFGYNSSFGTNAVLSLKDGKIGVGDKLVDYTSWEKDVWYHVEFVTDGENTAIYLDGVLVGTVAATMSGNWLGNPIEMGFDNFTVGNYSEDFEDDNFSSFGGNGYAYKYDFPEEEAVDPFITLGIDKVAEGGALLLEDKDGRGSGYADGYDSIGVKVNGAVAYVFDIALVDGAFPGEESDPDGSKTYFEIWRDVASKRFEVGFDTENTQLTGFAGEGDSVVGFDWGTFTADNFHNVVMVFKDRVGKIYVDGEKLYEGPAGSAGINGSNTTLFSIVGGSAIIDNFEIYDVEDENDIKLQTEAFMGNKINDNGSWEGLRGWTVGADCNENGHVYSHTAVTVNETCYYVGEDTDYCTVCGVGYMTHERAMIPHDFDNYDINRTADGLIYSACTNEGCVEKRYTSMTEEAYEGTINVFYGMEDDLAAMIYDSEDEPNWFDNFKFDGEYARTCEEAYIQNYSRLNLEYYNNKPNTTDWSVAFDMTYNGTWNTDDNTDNGYAHYTLWMLGGKNAMFLNFNVDTDKIYIESNPYSGTSIPYAEVDFDFVEGTTYAVQFAFHQYDIVLDEWENEDGEMEYYTEPAVDFYVYINGEVVLAYDYAGYEADIIGLAYENTDVSFSGFYNQNFGVDYSVDNFVIGSYDFAWSDRCYVGDVDGDNYLTANDALCMRKLLAKVVDGSDYAQDRMDINGDGAINAKDQLAIRKALAA